MCIAVPGKIISLNDEGQLMRSGKVDFGGIKREVNLALLPEAVIGDYVLVHAGFAISRVDEDEAVKIFQTFREWEDSLDE